MPDKQGKTLPPLPDDVFDGEKYSVEIKTEKCKHEPMLVSGHEIRCKKCGVGWSGPGIDRLYNVMIGKK